MRSVIAVSVFAAAVLIAPGRASAQDPEPRRLLRRAPRSERSVPPINRPCGSAVARFARPSVRRRKRGCRTIARRWRRPARTERPSVRSNARCANRGSVAAQEPTRREVVSVDDGAARRAVANADAATSADDQGAAARRGAASAEWRRPARDQADRAVPRSAGATAPHTHRRAELSVSLSPYYSRYYDPWGYGSFWTWLLLLLTLGVEPVRLVRTTATVRRRLLSALRWRLGF